MVIGHGAGPFAVRLAYFIRVQRITLPVPLARDLRLPWSAHRWDLVN
jgi:hypothetical protein